MKSSRFLTVLLLSLLAGSCSAMNETPPPTEEPVTPGSEDVIAMPDANPTLNPAALKLADQARADLALRLGIPAEQINIASAQAVTWPDSSLGCPQPGMAYAQVLTAGYLIQLEVNGRIYEYHAGRGGTIIFCENPSPPVPGAPGDT